MQRLMPKDGTLRVKWRLFFFAEAVRGTRYWMHPAWTVQRFNNYGDAGWWRTRRVLETKAAAIEYAKANDPRKMNPFQA